MILRNRVLVLVAGVLLLAMLSCATLREPGDPAPTRRPSPTFITTPQPPTPTPTPLPEPFRFGG